jgi:ferredoxin
MAVSDCISCGQCVSVCPVACLSEESEWRQVLRLLEEKPKVAGQGEGALSAAGARARGGCGCGSPLPSTPRLHPAPHPTP